MERKVWNEEEVNTLASQHLLLDQKLETLSELLNTLFTDSDVSQDDLRLVLLTAIEADEILLHHLGK